MGFTLSDRETYFRAWCSISSLRETFPATPNIVVRSEAGTPFDTIIAERLPPKRINGAFDELRRGNTTRSVITFAQGMP